MSQITWTRVAGLSDDALLTPAEVGTLFRVDAKTVARWAKSGRLATGIRTPGGHRRYRVADVRRLAEPPG